MVRWEDDKISSEPLQVICVDNPVSCAQYTLDNNLLTIDGWRRFKNIPKNKKKISCMVR